MSAVEYIVITLVILIVIVVIGFAIYRVNVDISNIHILPVTTDCSTYAAQHAILGTPDGPQCPTGTQVYGGVCYKDVWTENGGTKVAVCSVYYGTYGGVVTECGVGIFDLDYGAPCPMVGPDYYKTAVCTCQYKGEITGAIYCQDEGIADICQPGWDYFEGICYFQSCPEGYFRSEICSCQTN